ncbi:hypothetical protein AURDEDRAFT_169291 [Auricularia subglabra TFB-10046 SS5]|nr:hypothetical protein AURDEDRAFT_169291 [Auricularia subglabra TFB-10046 SS5]
MDSDMSTTPLGNNIPTKEDSSGAPSPPQWARLRTESLTIARTVFQLFRLSRPTLSHRYNERAQLPDDVLFLVFQQVLIDEDVYERYWSEQFTSNCVLSLVCRAWRRAALNTPSLWRFIHVDASRLGSYDALMDHIQLVRNFLDRSRGKVHRLCISNFPGITYDQPNCEKAWVTMISETLRVCERFYLVVGLGDKDVVANACDSPLLRVLRSLGSYPTPLLRQVTLTVGEFSSVPLKRFSLDQPLFNTASAPSLHGLSISGIDLRLSSFAVCTHASLTSLEFCTGSFSEDIAPLIAAHHQTLQNLTLYHVVIDDDVIAHPTFPALTVLNLAGPSSAVLTRFGDTSFPRLAVVRIEFSTDLSAHHLHFFAASHPEAPIRALILCRKETEFTPYIPAIFHLYRLQSLTLLGHIEKSFFSTLVGLDWPDSFTERMNLLHFVYVESLDYLAPALFAFLYKKTEIEGGPPFRVISMDPVDASTGIRPLRFANAARLFAESPGYRVANVPFETLLDDPTFWVTRDFLQVVCSLFGILLALVVNAVSVLPPPVIYASYVLSSTFIFNKVIITCLMSWSLRPALALVEVGINVWQYVLDVYQPEVRRSPRKHKPPPPPPPPRRLRRTGRRKKPAPPGGCADASLASGSQCEAAVERPATIEQPAAATSQVAPYYYNKTATKHLGDDGLQSAMDSPTIMRTGIHEVPNELLNTPLDAPTMGDAVDIEHILDTGAPHAPPPPYPGEHISMPLMSYYPLSRAGLGDHPAQFHHAGATHAPYLPEQATYPGERLEFASALYLPSVYNGPTEYPAAVQPECDAAPSPVDEGEPVELACAGAAPSSAANATDCVPGPVATSEATLYTSTLPADADAISISADVDSDVSLVDTALAESVHADAVCDDAMHVDTVADDNRTSDNAMQDIYLDTFTIAADASVHDHAIPGDIVHTEFTHAGSVAEHAMYVETSSVYAFYADPVSENAMHNENIFVDTAFAHESHAAACHSGPGPTNAVRTPTPDPIAEHGCGIVAEQYDLAMTQDSPRSSPPTSTSPSPPPRRDFHDENNLILNIYGPWSRSAFGRRVAKMAAGQGDPPAIRFVLESFPHLDLKDAWLWVEYIKTAYVRAGDFDVGIMDHFKFAAWWATLSESQLSDFAEYDTTINILLDLFPSFQRVQTAYKQLIVGLD